VGGALVAVLRDRCEARGLAWIGLIGEPGTQAFYERLGFRPMAGYVPMLLERDRGEGR
jgi:spermidine synthase